MKRYEEAGYRGLLVGGARHHGRSEMVELPGGLGGSARPGLVSTYVEVDDVAATLAQANQLGGSTLIGPTWAQSKTIALLAGPEGNVVGLTERL